MLDDTLLADWCLKHLGGPLERVLFRSGFLSEVIGVELSGGLRAVVKARPAEPRIVGCVQVQAALADAGFPCPRPLTTPTRVADMTVTAEAEVSGGSPRPAEAGAAPFAALLARLIASAPAPTEVASLKPSPPWAGWDHTGQRLWADLDEHGQDLNHVSVPEWVDNAARRVRDRLTSTRGQVCVGHGDWEPQNIRWTGSEVLVVHDWDSVIAQPEAAIVGIAAASPLIGISEHPQRHENAHLRSSSRHHLAALRVREASRRDASWDQASWTLRTSLIVFMVGAVVVGSVSRRRS